MNHIRERILLFLIGCIGLRSLFVVIAKYINPNYLKYLGYLALLQAIGFIYIYLTGSRKTGGETFGDKIWWNAIMGNKQSWIYLLIDVLFGLLSFTVHHYLNGDFLRALKA